MTILKRDSAGQDLDGGKGGLRGSISWEVKSSAQKGGDGRSQYVSSVEPMAGTAWGGM